ncbi:MAG: bifunctional diaminohydroxyphosphoribosylaminopyrimidine deaminase/5-amino-6-(5-phosphoribosylamino)uracil reductase RibD [Syntrophomonadaceae bacterium]
MTAEKWSWTRANVVLGMGIPEDQEYMCRALALASRALGRTSPNPVVGAVIVKDGRIIGEGYHIAAGTPHAEVHALRAAGEEAAGSTLYVTLEPCSHFGRTPPCADAVIAAGIKRVVVAVADPNPQVSGRGITKLAQAGIEVEVGILQKEASRLNEIFFKYIRTQLPFVALKTAMTLDGKIASVSGDSRWITGEKARLKVHQLRDIYDSIMVGIGTVLKDDPQLNTRLPGMVGHDPVRVIIDPHLDIPVTSKIATTSNSQRSLVFCTDGADHDRRQQLRSLGMEICPLAGQSDFIPLDQVLLELGEMGLCSVLVEGGGEINASLLDGDLIDKVYWFIAPKIIGGKQAPGPIGGIGIPWMKDARALESVEIEKIGDDFLITGYFKEWC